MLVSLNFPRLEIINQVRILKDSKPGANRFHRTNNALYRSVQCFISRMNSDYTGACQYEIAVILLHTHTTLRLTTLVVK